MEKLDNPIWNIKIDSERMVVIYSSDKNHQGQWDYDISEATNNMAKIASKLNLPVENVFNRVKFQMTPGMTADEGCRVWEEAYNIRSQKLSEKNKFIEEHKQKLADSKAIHDDVLLGIMNTDLPHHELVGKKNKDDEFADFIISSHLFQEKVAESPEFSDMLRDVKKAAKIYLLKENIFQKEQKKGKEYGNISDDILEFNDSDGNPYDFDKGIINEDEAKNYDSLHEITKDAINNEFYRRNKDNLADVLGKENLSIIKSVFDKSITCDAIVLDDKCYRVEEGALRFGTTSSYKHKNSQFVFINDLCSGKLPEKGDKILLSAQAVTDAELGKLRKIDGYMLKDGKYVHFYQEYFTAQEKRTVSNSLSVTKAIQQRTPVARESNKIER